MSIINVSKKICKPVFPVLVAVILTACGGGGGGSDSPGVGTVPGGGDLIDITFENTSEVASLSTQPFLFVDVLEDFWFSDSLMDESIDGPAGGRATISSDSGSLVINYENFSVTEEIVINGIQRQVFLEDDFSLRTNNEFTPIEGQLIFEDFRLLSEDADLIIDGVLSTSDIQGSVINIDIVGVDNLSGEILTIEDTVITYDSTNSVDEVADIRGSVFSSRIGQIVFTTENPLINPIIDPGSAEFTAEGNGILTIEGEDSVVKLVTQNTQFVSFVFDTDNDGQFESSVRQTWDNINDGVELGDLESVGLNAPVANPGASVGLQILQAPFLITSLHSHDEDSALLNHEWKLELSPPDSEITLEAVNEPYFFFEPDVVGEYIYSLIVNDGQNSSKVGVKLTVDNSRISFFDFLSNEIGGALEVIESFDGEQYQYDLSADSAVDQSATFISLNWGLQTPNFSSTASLPFNPGGVENQFTTDPLFEGFHRVTVSGSGLSNRTEISFTSGGIVQDFFADIVLEESLNSVKNVDINGDGLEDFVGISVSDFNDVDGQLFIYLSQGNGRYSFHQQIESGGEMLTVEDINNDGRLDLITLSPINDPQFNSDYEIRYSVQDESGQFEEFTSISIADLLSTEFNPVIASGSGNFDNDPENEYWVILEGQRRFSGSIPDIQPQLLIWDADAFASPPRIVDLNAFDVLNNVSGVATALVEDINSDGMDDVVLGLDDAVLGFSGFGLPNSLVLVWENSTDDFELSEIIMPTLRSMENILFFDQNNDSENDLMILGRNSINVFRGLESGGFEQEPSQDEEFSNVDFDNIEVADFDLDGYLDILASSRFDNGILINDNGVFRVVNLMSNSDLPFDSQEISVFDYNVDGFPDIVTPSDSGVRVFLGGLRSFSTLVE